MHRFRFLGTVVWFFALTLILTTAMTWAQSFQAPTFRPGRPVMQYEARQDVGYPDKLYRDDKNAGAEVTEPDCRYCHGTTTNERHHNTIYAQLDNCLISDGGCHEVIPNPPDVEAVRDCKLCHTDDPNAQGAGNPFFAQWGDLGYPHHNTWEAGSGTCTECHTNIVETFSVPIDYYYPPSSITPSPASCENCHWWDLPEPYATISAPGALSHFGASGTTGPMHPDKLTLGFDRYVQPNVGTHHGTKGLVYAGGDDRCFFCHGTPSGEYVTDPYTGYAIRYCENCHTEDSLHGIAEHVYGRGKEVGPEPFDDFGCDQIAGTGDTGEFNDYFDPCESYTELSGDTTWNVQYGPQYIDANSRCIGCHGDRPPDIEIPATGPTIDQVDYSISEASAGIGTFGSKFQVIEILGSDFGDMLAGDVVEMKGIGACSTAWFSVPIYGGEWTDTRILGRIPVEKELDGCNCKIRLTKAPIPDANYPGFKVSSAGITVNAHPVIEHMEPFLDENTNGTWDPDVNAGRNERCYVHWNQWVTVFGDGFAATRASMAAPFTGDSYQREAIVEIHASADKYRATRYKNWTDTSFQFKLNDLYDVSTGQMVPEEQLYETDWEVKVTQKYYTDNNSSGWYFDVDDTLNTNGIRGEIDPGDLLHYEEISEPESALNPAKIYVYTQGTPEILSVRPRQGPKGTKVRLIGLHFGTELWDSILHFSNKKGTKDKYMDKNSMTKRIKLWSNTKIKFKAPGFKIPPSGIKKIRVWVDVPDLDETDQYASSNEKIFKLTN